MTKRNSNLLLLVAAVWIVAPLAQADIDEALDGMFVLTGSEPAVYDSQRRGGVDFGTFRLRAPMSSVNVLNFTPPDIRAGCGGIDLYGGSFTFINAEQFRQVIRQIGANAIGYAFKLALATMCPRCDQILTGLQDVMRDLSKMNVDSCRWAQGIVNDAVKSAGWKAAEAHMSEETITGVYEDYFDAIQASFNDYAETVAFGDPNGANPDNENMGNITWNALQIDNSAALFSFTPGNLTHDELLMNLVGTTLRYAPNDDEIAAGSAGVTNEEREARISFEELRRGKIESTDPLIDATRVYKCPATDLVQCLRLEEIDEWSFEGIDAWMEARLQAVADHMKDPNTAGSEHDADTKDFLGHLPIDVMRHMLELQGSNSLDRYVMMATPYISASYSVVFAESLVAAVEAAFEGTDAPDIPEHVKQRIKELKKEIQTERRKVEDEFKDEVREMEVLVEELLRIESRDRAGMFKTNLSQ